jgi:hypothetical protein
MKMSSHLCPLLPALLAQAFLCQVVQAETVYEQLPPADFNGALRISSTLNFIGEMPGFRRADDFQITLDSKVDHVQWWGEPRPRTNDFTFAFYADSGGLPSSLLLSTGGHGLVSTPTSPSVSHRMYTATLNTPFVVTSGIKYWFSVFDQGPESQWGWLTASRHSGMAHAFTLVPPGDSWAIDNEFSLAYRLTTPVPEPSTLVLLAIAYSIGGLLCCIRHFSMQHLPTRAPFVGDGDRHNRMHQIADGRKAPHRRFIDGLARPFFRSALVLFATT